MLFEFNWSKKVMSENVGQCDIRVTLEVSKKVA